MLVLPVPGSRARTGCGTVQGMSEPIQSPVFVGRREEIESLAALLRRAADGEPGFAIVAGEAGVGKTRLVTELAGRAADSGFTVLAGHCVEPSVHVSNILAKLGVDSRVEAAAVAHRLGVTG